MTKKIHSTVLLCFIAVLLCLPSVLCNVEAFNPTGERDVGKSLNEQYNVHHTKADDEEEKKMLKELMGDFDSLPSHTVHGNAYDDYTKHTISSHDQLIHHENDVQTKNSQPHHHEDPKNAHNMEKTRNPATDKPTTSSESDIRPLDFKADNQFHYYNTYSCTYLKVPVHHGNIDLAVQCLGNADKAMLTTTLLKNCSQLMQFHCANETSFCRVHDLMHEADIKLYHDVADVEEAYLYILPHKISEELAFKVKATTIQGITVKHNESVHDMCSKRNVDTCREHENPCHSRCNWAACGFMDGSDFNVAGGACFATGTQRSDIETYCTSFPEFAATKHRVPSFPLCHYTPAPKNLHSMALVGFAVFSVLFMALVCFYRYQFRKYGSGFFTPPKWCPRFLFPSKQGELQNSFYKDIVKGQGLEMDYQPPVL